MIVDESEATTLLIGDRLLHNIFGPGTVVGFRQANNRSLLEVDFENFGMRLLDPRFAKLKKFDSEKCVQVAIEEMEDKTPIDRPWKAQLSSILTNVTGQNSLLHGFCDYGRKIQPETVCVILDASPFELPPFKLVSAAGAIEGQPGSYLEQVRRQLPQGFVSYIGTTRWKRPRPKFGVPVEDFVRAGIELAIGPGDTQFDILRLARTEAVNYSLTTDQMIDILRSIDETVGIDVLSATADALYFRLLDHPDEPLQLAETLFGVCPDLSSGTDTQQLARTLQTKQIVGLWWD